MIEAVGGQPVRPRQAYGNINIQINMTTPPNRPMPPKALKEDEHVCPHCGYYYDVPKISIYTTELKPEKTEKPKIADRVIVIPQQTVVDKDKEGKIADKVTPQKVIHTAPKVTNPISEVKPKTIEIVKPDAAILQTKKEEKTEEIKQKEIAAPKKIEIVKPENLKPVIDINTIIAELVNPDFAKQADAIGTIAQVSQASPEIGAQLLDVRVIDTLLGIINTDTSNLPAPTFRQLQIRQAILNNQPVTDAERIEASVKAPVERAEENKELAIYALASLQKVYGKEVSEMGGKITSLNDLPGAKEVVKEIKTNGNPHIRTAGLSALHYLQTPEYSAELQAVYQNAAADQNPVVRAVAQKALELNA